MIGLSIIFPVYNEEKLLAQNTRKIVKYLEKLKSVKTFEILLCPNGCTDNTVKIAKELTGKDKRVKCWPNKERGIGVGLKKGIKQAKYDYSMFYAIDLPFGLEVIEDSIKAIEDADIVIGSKGHVESVGWTNPKRKILSLGYNTIIRLFFGIKVRDTQGSLLFKTAQVRKYFNKLTAKTPFLQTQIVIHGHKSRLRIKEMKTKFKASTRDTRMRTGKDAVKMFKDVVKEVIQFY